MNTIVGSGTAILPSTPARSTYRRACLSERRKWRASSRAAGSGAKPLSRSSAAALTRKARWSPDARRPSFTTQAYYFIGRGGGFSLGRTKCLRARATCYETGIVDPIVPRRPRFDHSQVQWIPCPVCSIIVFDPKPLSGRPAKYCSPACRQAAYRARRYELTHPAPNTGR